MFDKCVYVRKIIKFYLSLGKDAYCFLKILKNYRFVTNIVKNS